MRTFSITTLGCKVNQCESETIADRLRACGAREVSRTGGAGSPAVDLCIINTCTVTQKASMQSRQAIRQAIRANPRARILVTGCDAQMAAGEIEQISGVDCIVAHRDKLQIPEMIGPSLGEAAAPGCSTPPSAPAGRRTRPFLKVQDGCNAFCTYCIVPHARGRSLSLPLEKVLQRLQQLKAEGYHEVVLTGIHLGSYGGDLVPPDTLFGLLQQIDAAKLMERIRLSSIEPCELSDAILSLIVTSNTVCRHLHIPLQSGDDHILEQMHRPYGGMFFKTLVEKIHRQLPTAAIGTDVLVGFPGETDAAFENTCDLIRRLPLTYLHVFPFSPRRGTPAERFPGRVPEDVIRHRCRKLRQLGGQKKAAFYRQSLGRRVRVLVEGKRDRATGLLKGFTSNYIPVLLAGESGLHNRLVEVQIEKINGFHPVYGSVCG